MNATATTFQPEFISSLLLAVQTALATLASEKLQQAKEAKSKEPVFVETLGMKEHDSTKPISTDNLARTTLYLEKKATPTDEGAAIVISDENFTPSPYSVHVSHSGQALENGDVGHYMVFETAQGKLFPKTVTRQYVTKGYLDGKLIKVALRDEAEAVNDVIKFLTTGVAPQ